MYLLLILSAAVASLSMLIAKSKLFVPVREFFDLDLLHCPLCLAFWIAAPFIYMQYDYDWYRMAVLYFAVTTLADAWMLVIAKLYLALDEMDYEPE